MSFGSLRQWPRALLVASLALAFAPDAGAGTVSRAGELDRSPVIAIDGMLELADLTEFQRLVGTLSNPIVALRSPGGELRAGLGIGTLIREKGLRSFVPSDALCASACALAWLGGKERFAGARAQIGFHAAYKMEDGKASETGAGNALVGAYLSRLSLSDRAIVFVTQAPPERMNWLTPAQAGNLGITMTAFAADLDRVTAGNALFGRGPEVRQAAVADTAPEQASLRSSHSDWRLYVGGTGQRKTCHVVSARNSGPLPNASLTISRRPFENVRFEVAFSAEGVMQQGPAGAITVDEVSYPLVVRGQNAWVRRADEAEVVTRMARASAFTTILRSGTGTPVSHRFSTNGLEAALARAEAECP